MSIHRGVPTILSILMTKLGTVPKKILQFIVRTIQNSQPFIPIGCIERQKGEIDWILLLFFVLLLKVWQFQLFYRTAQVWADSYQAMEDNARKQGDEWDSEFEAFGQTRVSPPMRIDYGSNNSGRNRDAEALCIVGEKVLLNEDFQKLHCG
jgi:hypothetical protein